ncbi:organomercurial lyase [Streptomyces sp. NPDC005408]|uniref:organomercurial lyase n=1 Tax=Streptomyces sp. NPDC005408 TaxID=3155341 RepID=UPI0033ADEE52
MSWEDATMQITVLAVPGCPNAPVVRERIRAALDGRPADLDLVEVHDEAEAARLGMTGSPTVLLDGVDPFAAAGTAVPTVSCRLYRDMDGRVDGAPSVAALRQALAAEVDVLDPIGRGGRGRLAPVSGGLRAVQQAVLRHFAEAGAAPAPALLEPVSAPFGRRAGEVLAELAREDFVTLDEAGRIRAAYPFSARPTRHRVRIIGGPEVWSMCAIDALGVGAMLDTDVVVSSSDPMTDARVTITVHDGQSTWEPADAVVFVGRRACSGSAAAVCCDALNFFTGRASAAAWAIRHPDVTGRVVDQARAEELGRQTFGLLLSEG